MIIWLSFSDNLVFFARILWSEKNLSDHVVINFQFFFFFLIHRIWSTDKYVRLRSYQSSIIVVTLK